MNRSGLIGLLALIVGGSGCAGTARRDDGTRMFKPRAWSAAPAPEQVQVTPMPASRIDSGNVAKVDPQGLSKYFPSLRRVTPEPTNLATNYRPSWFGPRKPKAPAQVYTTDARPGLNRGAAEPSLLPVALRVPTDPSVRPTAAEAVSTAPAGTPEMVVSEAKKPYDEDVNPLPPAAEPEATKVIDRMPDLPAIDPRQESTPVAPANDPVVATDRERVSDPDAARKGDEKAVKAITDPNDASRSLGLPEVTLPASYVRRDTMPAPGHAHTHDTAKGPVLASPQVEPTAKIAPSPQSGLKTTEATKKWRRPCLRRFVRKTWKLGEYANPPTAAPH